MSRLTTRRRKQTTNKNSEVFCPEGPLFCSFFSSAQYGLFWFCPFKTNQHSKITHCYQRKVFYLGASKTTSVNQPMGSKLLSLLLCFVFLWSSSSTRLYCGLTSDNFTCCHTRDRAGRLLSQCTDTDPTSREQAATAGTETRASSAGAARSTD